MYQTDFLVGDGTFKTCPKEGDFTGGQAYTIHTELNGEPVRICTLLMGRRTRHAYELAFNWLRQTMLNENNGLPPPNLTRFLVDCEAAVISAIETTFGQDGVTPDLCLFHFDQCILRWATKPPSLQVEFFQKDPKHPIRRWIRRLLITISLRRT